MNAYYHPVVRAGMALLLFYAASGCSSPAVPPAVPNDSTLTVSLMQANGQEGDQVTLSGQLLSAQSAAISTRVMGYITAIPVKVGDKVQQGQLLVTIASQDIAARRAQADAAIAEAEAALASAQKDYDRFTVLYKQQSATQKELDNSALQYHSAQARVAAAREVSKEASVNMAYANITAPFTGVITQKMTDAGSLANPGMPLLMLERTGDYQVSAYATENQVGLLHQGMPLTVTIAASNAIIHTQISQISESAQNTGGQYLLKANIPAAESKGLYPGTYVQVSIPVKSNVVAADNQVWIPASALVHQEELDGVYTVNGEHKAMLRWLRLGKTRGGEVEVLSGLGHNETFIVHANGRLYNGAPVRVQ